MCVCVLKNLNCDDDFLPEDTISLDLETNSNANSEEGKESINTELNHLMDDDQNACIGPFDGDNLNVIDKIDFKF